MNKANKIYKLLYSSNKSIFYLSFGNSEIHTPYLVYETDTYQDLIDFIYNENLYKDENTFIDLEDLKAVEPDVEETLFKYDD
jgi:hypothetical protein|tara:strand:- start:278 stop:523 length:246 start_codon:yes stop_codon:yes gene_type:complete